MREKPIYILKCRTTNCVLFMNSFISCHSQTHDTHTQTHSCTQTYETQILQNETKFLIKHTLHTEGHTLVRTPAHTSAHIINKNKTLVPDFQEGKENHEIPQFCFHTSLSVSLAGQMLSSEIQPYSRRRLIGHCKV